MARPRRAVSSRKGVLAQPAAAAKSEPPQRKSGAFFALGLARAPRALCLPSSPRPLFSRRRFLASKPPTGRPRREQGLYDPQALGL